MLPPVLPPTLDVKGLGIQHGEPARTVAVGVAEHRDDDIVTGHAVDGVGTRQSCFADDLVRLDHLFQLGAARVVGDIDDVDARGAEAGNDQMRSVRPMTGGAAAIPTVVVQLIPDVRHRKLMRHRRVRVGVRVRVDDGEEVRLVHVGALMKTGDIEELLARRRQGLLRRGVKRCRAPPVLAVLVGMIVIHRDPLPKRQRAWNIPPHSTPPGLPGRPPVTLDIEDTSAAPTGKLNEHQEDTLGRQPEPSRGGRLRPARSRQR